ncbi:hypothetical protein [Jannaschia sp. W003]|uniref:hypothetical protein n=1 Tax=Jannaschia sp. W003 TaxID=2867012 RepID=UPI0021A73EF9|nr:hypothetical protein [Jannaschia sp. W003]UWQ22066.1 hypothetical protein K3554_03275 [Jannaschia sp. W003]
MHEALRITLALAGLGLGALAAWGLGLAGWAIALASAGFAATLALFEAVSNLRFPPRLHAGVVLYALAALLLGEHLQVYEALPWWDLALHVVSAAVLAVVGFGLALLPTAGAPPRTALWVLGTLAFGFAMMAGALWEVLEFALDQLFGTNAQDSGLVDTMWDVIANTLGAVAGAVAGHAALLSGRRLPLGGLLLDVVEANPVLYGLWRGPLRRPEGQPRGALAGADGAFERGGQPRADVIPGE